MAVNKIFIGSDGIDLTGDTVTKDKVTRGYQFHDRAGNVLTGENDFDVDSSSCNATENDIVAGKSGAVGGTIVNGKIPVKGKQTLQISTKDQKVTIPYGVHDGTGYAELDPVEKAKLIGANIAEGITLFGVPGEHSGTEGEIPETGKVVTPTFEVQTVTPGADYTCFKEITVAAIPVVRTENAYGTTITVG